MLLEVDDLQVNYGHIEAIRGVSFSVPEGTVTSLVGANGAGKTTTLKTVSGLRKVRGGAIRFQGEDITQLAPFEHHVLARRNDIDAIGLDAHVVRGEHDRQLGRAREDLGQHRVVRRIQMLHDVGRDAVVGRELAQARIALDRHGKVARHAIDLHGQGRLGEAGAGRRREGGARDR